MTGKFYRDKLRLSLNLRQIYLGEIQGIVKILVW